MDFHILSVRVKHKSLDKCDLKSSISSKISDENIEKMLVLM